MDKIIALAENYLESALINRAAHYRAAKIANQKHILIGLPATLISTIVGTAIFASLNANPNNLVKIIAGLISLFGAILSALQTFFKFSEITEKHRIAGAKYGDVKRKLDLFLLKCQLSEYSSQSDAFVDIIEITDMLSGLAQESPDIPDNAYSEAKKIEESRNE